MNQSVFTKEMTIKEVLGIDRTTAPIMMTHGMPCMGCGAHGSDVDELVEKLNEYLNQKA